MITHEVIKKAQQGDSDAFTRIYNDTIKTAYYVAKRILLDEQAVEDVLQESYIAIYEHLGDYKAGNFQGWVDTIVANRSKNYLRKKNPILFSQMETEDNINIEFEEEKIEFRPDEKVDYDETKRLVMEIVDGLSDEQRLSIILFYFEQRSVKEIAEICECSENTVKSRLNYARKKIKEDVLELEKKGTKLYSVSVLPFLYWLFKEEFKACEVPASTTTNVAHATGKAIERATGKTSSLSNAGTKATETVAKVVVEETVKTGMALGTKIAIGVVVATVSIGGIALGSTLLKDTIPPTEQSSEYSSQQDIETEQEAKQDTQNEYTPLSEEEMLSLHEFLLYYNPEEKISNATDEIYTVFSEGWCNNTIILFIRNQYYVQGKSLMQEMWSLYCLDRTTGTFIEIEKPACVEDGERGYQYEFYTKGADILIVKTHFESGNPSFYVETMSENGLIEKNVSEEEMRAILGDGDYEKMSLRDLSEVQGE